MFAIFFAFIARFFIKRWFENFLAMRRIHKSILAQQRRMYGKEV